MTALWICCNGRGRRAREGSHDTGLRGRRRGGAIPGFAVLGLLVGGVTLYVNRADKQELARKVESVEVRKILDSAMKSSHQDQVALKIKDLSVAPTLARDAVGVGSWEFSNSFLAPASRERAKAASDSDVVRQSAAIAVCLLGRLAPPDLGNSVDLVL